MQKIRKVAARSGIATVLLLTLLLAACNQGGGTQTTQSPDTDAGAQDSPAPRDAAGAECELLTTAEVAEVTGFTEASLQANPLADGCQYESDDGRVIVMLRRNDLGKAEYDSAVASDDSAEEVSVEGATAASYLPQNRMVVAYRGSTFFEVQADGPKSFPIELAGKIAAKV